MPVPVGGMGGRGGPSCWDRVKMGAVMGAAVGACSGLLFGGFGAYRMALRGRELWTQVGKGVASGAGSFGVFMAVGSGIRC